MTFDPALFTEIWLQLRVVLLVVALDVVVGVAAAFKAKEFDLEYFPQFLADYGMKIFGWLVIEVVVRMPGDLLGLAGIDPVVGATAFSILVGGAIASALKNAQFLFGVELTPKFLLPAREEAEAND